MPRCRPTPISPPCSSSDEDQSSHPGRPCSSSDEEAVLVTAANMLNLFEQVLTPDSEWNFGSAEARLYRQAGYFDSNRARALQLIDFYIDSYVDRLMEERMELGWAPASPAAYQLLKEDDGSALRWTIESFECVPWLFVLRAFDTALRHFAPLSNLRRDADPDRAVTVEGLAWEIRATGVSQVRNSVYSTVLESDWE